MLNQLLQQLAAAVGALVVHYLVKRFKPLGDFFFRIHFRTGGEFQDSLIYFVCRHFYLKLLGPLGRASARQFWV